MHERLGWRELAWWTLAFCLHRLAVLWWGFDGTYYWEETYRLLIAEALWHGWSWPLFDLQADPYAGGSLFFSLLTAPVVALVGPSLIGLKLVALAWSAVGFVAWTALVDRWWGRRAAHVFAFLFVTAPPLFVVYNLIAMGSHAEVVTLAGVQLLLAYRVLYGARTAPALVAWGVGTGASIWFTYVAALPFVVCVAIGLLTGALPPRAWPALAAGFLAGLSPWIAANAVSGGRGLEVVGTTLQVGRDSGRSFGAVLEYLGYLVWTGVPLGLRYPDVFAAITGGAPRRLLLAHLYFAVYAGSVAVLVWTMIARRARDRPGDGTATVELPLLALFPLFLVVLAASNQVFLEYDRVPFLSFRLLVPFLPVVMAVIAIALARVPPVIRSGALLLLGALGAASTVHVLQAGAAGRAEYVAGARVVGAHAAGHLLYYKHGPDLPLLRERVDAMPSELRASAWEGVGFSLAYHFPADRSPHELLGRLDAVPAEYRANAMHGMRLALGPGLPQVNPRPPMENTSALRNAVGSLDPPKPDQ